MLINEPSLSSRPLTKEQRQYLKQIIAGFTGPRDELSKRRERVQLRIGIVLAFCICIPFISTLMIFGLQDALPYAQKGDWWNFFKTVWPGIFLLLAAPNVIGEVKKYSALPKKGADLRTMLNDEEKIPIAIEQPAALKSDEWPQNGTLCGPVKPWKTMAALCSVVGILCLLAGVGLITLLVYSLQNGHASTIDFIMTNVMMGVLILLCSIVAYALLLAARNIYRFSIIKVDDEGLRWWNIRYAYVAWHEVQGFYLMRYQSKKGKMKKVYVLDGSDISLTWTIDEHSTPGNRAASDCFAQLVVTRTQLPLRDLSIVLERLISEV